MSKSKKKIPAVVEFYDIAGLVKGASTGEGLGNQFLTHIRDTQAIAIVLRVFQNPDIIHVEASVDPLRDMEIILTELALKDLEIVERRLGKLEGEARTGEKKAVQNLETLKRITSCLQEGKSIAEFRDEEIVGELALLSAKKQLYLLNGRDEEVPQDLRDKIDEVGAEYLVADLGNVDAVPELIRKAYAMLGLVSFFTTGEDETRAWTITRGDKTPQAAGVIHTDFEKNFIRAEVVPYQKFLETGGWIQAKQKGLLRVEGKEYVVQDGDVMVIRHG